MTTEDCKRISDALWGQTNLTVKDIEDTIVALEKQIPKKPIRFNCPVCSHYFEDSEPRSYCPICGQAIDLSEVKNDIRKSNKMD